MPFSPGDRVWALYRGTLTLATVMSMEGDRLNVKPAKYPSSVSTTPDRIKAVEDVPLRTGEVRCSKCRAPVGNTNEEAKAVTCSLCVLEMQMLREYHRNREVQRVREQVSTGSALTPEILALIKKKIKATQTGNKKAAKAVRNQLRELGYKYSDHKGIEKKLRDGWDPDERAVVVHSDQAITKSTGYTLIKEPADTSEDAFDEEISRILKRGKLRGRSM